MIVFDGVITGETYKRFKRKQKTHSLRMLIIPCVLVFSFPFIFLQMVFHPGVAAALAGLLTFVFGGLILLHPFTKKDWLAITPKRIVIEDDIMTCEMPSYTEDRHVDDVDIVYDAGEYYDVVFRFGRVSTKFVCQKDLLSKGSLKEFETLFEDRLIVKDKK